MAELFQSRRSRLPMAVGWQPTKALPNASADEQIAHMARHDALTDLPNRVNVA
jgi:hypothetical protein